VWRARTEMARANKETKLEGWAAATGMTVDEVKFAWEELQRRGLSSAKRDKVTVSPLAMRRATSDTQRRLASHLSGYLLTENSFIVRRAGDPPGLPCILNTRISVEQIAAYFNEGWGVTEIEHDLNIVTRAEIEAAIQYYLNHRGEIERDLQRSRELYEEHAPREETVPA
jgi:uncharacterized protein (DUF433 family)